MSITIDKVVEAFVETRDTIKAREAELEESLKALKELQAKREDWLLGELNRAGAQNIKTPHGTCYIALKESVTVADWDTALQWVKENDKYEFLEKRISKTAVIELMGDKKENPPPPGVNYTAVRTVNIRRS